MPVPFVPSVDFSTAPMLWEFLNDANPFRFLIGPVGSGKSTACVTEVMRRAMEQEPAQADGYRYFKAGVVRNTMAQLIQTTLETWLAIFPEDSCGPVRRSSPMRHNINIPSKNWRSDLPVDDPGQGAPGLHLMVEFFALDRPKDVRKLLSWEGTMIWFNEVREIPKPIIDAADGRVGRYPSDKHGGVEPTWFGIIADTNPPDEDHWLYELDIGERPIGWSFYHQPPGVIEMKQDGKAFISVDPKFPGFVVSEDSHIFQAARTLWAVNPAAENLPNLPFNRQLDRKSDPDNRLMRQLGQGGYYARQTQGKHRDWIRGYLQGRYGYIQEGKPVIPEFSVDDMVVDNLPVIPDVKIGGGLDFGGNTLNPAAIFGQRHRGIYLIHAECVGSDIGLNRFAPQMKQTFADTFPGRKHDDEGIIHGDPAGAVKDGVFETVAFDNIRSHGFNVQPAPSQDPKVRINGIKAPMGRYVDGKPGILIHRRCKTLIKGLAGAWRFRKLGIANEERYAEKPEKSHPYSDVCEAAGYYLTGSGEYSETKREGGRTAMTQGNAVVDFDVFG